MRHMTQDQTELAIATFVEEVELYANDGSNELELELVTAELFDAHPLTNVLIATSRALPTYRSN